MITGHNIAKVIDLFKSRGVMLYHACQLQDFEAYLNIGGIPSRRRLEASNKEFTTFATDGVDRVNGVWDKVFVNLSDFGTTFANGGGGTPNPYGPILLTISPSVLLGAEDIAITLRSAGAADFDRDRESLSNCEEVDRLFSEPVEEGYPASTFIKYKGELQAEFNFPQARSPEINCSFPGEYLPIRYIQSIKVDPYNFEGELLINLVAFLIKSHKFLCELRIRRCKCTPRIALYNEILQIIFEELPSFQQILLSDNSSEDMKTWIMQLHKANLEYQFGRFASYLREGTIFPALSMINR